jgi:uncharacterized Zn finger protein (UPF0148 family)
MITEALLSLDDNNSEELAGQCSVCGMVDLVMEVKDGYCVCPDCQRALVRTFEDDFRIGQLTEVKG